LDTHSRKNVIGEGRGAPLVAPSVTVGSQTS
jgi:hypothetical protein